MRVGSRRLSVLLSVLAVAFWATSVLALPPVTTSTYTSDQLQFTLRVPSIAIEGDPRSFCSIDITMVGIDGDTLSSGDVVRVEVFIDDGYWSDTQIFASTYSVTSAEAGQQRFSRTVDCTGNFRSDGESSISIYGKVDGDPDAWITNRRGLSGNVSVSVKDEDENNNDNSAAAAQPLGSGVSSRIAKDADWYSLTASGGTVNLTLTFDAGSGNLDLALTDAGGTTLASGVRFASGLSITQSGLSAGTYKVKVSPRATNDPNFYDLMPTSSGGGGGGGGSTDPCTGNGRQERDCGNCGTQSRTCNGTTYSAWGACGSQGECAPGDSQTTNEGCASGQVKRLSCSEECAWESGACATDDGSGSGSGGGSGTGTGENGGMVGRSCTEAEDCGGSLTCVGPEDNEAMFRNGYCSISPCNADSVCRDGNAICGGLFGDTYCLTRCTDSSECRSGYICARFGNARACVPRCRDNDDCGDSALPYCDATSGLCLASEDADAQAWNGPRPNPDGSTTGGSGLADAGGCAQLGFGSWTSIFGAMLLAARVAARRAARLTSRRSSDDAA